MRSVVHSLSLPFPVISSIRVNVLRTVLVFAYRFSLSKKEGQAISPKSISIFSVVTVVQSYFAGKKQRLNTLDNAYIHTVQIMGCFLMSLLYEELLGAKVL